jgi:inner membrane protein
MMAGSHLVVGLAAWAWAAPHLGLPPLAPTELGLAALGAMLPDIDHPKSWIGQHAWVVSRPLSAVAGHRGFTHSLLAIAACILVLRAHGVPRAIAGPLVVGYLSHLAADLLTPAGLRLAWPARGHLALPLCRTGSPAEPLVVALLAGWLVARACGMMPRHF